MRVLASPAERCTDDLQATVRAGWPGILAIPGDTLTPDIQSQAEERSAFVEKLVAFFLHEGFQLHGVIGSTVHPTPPVFKNPQFGSMTPRCPDVIGFDPVRHRIVFGLVRPTRSDLDSEDSLEEYNLFLDQNVALGDRAAAVYVLMPSELIPEFTSMITHYIHREYWNRIIPVAADTPEPAP